MTIEIIFFHILIMMNLILFFGVNLFSPSIV